MGERILVVDDAAFMRMMIKDILVKNGFDVVGEAADGAQAIEKFQELKPDLVTMDITMPEMDGISALKEIKKRERYHENVKESARKQKGLTDRMEKEARDAVAKQKDSVKHQPF